jgi:hypothetical protein
MQRGQAILPLVLVLAVILGLIGITLAGTSYVQTLLSGQRTFAEQARQTAQSGINDALLRITRDKNWGTDSDPNATESNPATYTLTVGSFSSDVSVDRSLSANGRLVRTIVSSATVRNVQRGFRVVVEVSSSGGVHIVSREEIGLLGSGAPPPPSSPFDGDGIAQSDTGEVARAIAVDSSAIYIAGYQNQISGGCSTASGCWRIEKRDLTTGALITAFDNDGIAQSDPTSLVDNPNAIAVDGSAVYIAGHQDTGGDCSTGSWCWRIEKRDKTTGALVTAFDGDGIVLSDPTSEADIARAIAVDGSAVYVAGIQWTGAGCSTGNYCWRIEKRDKSTGALVTAFDNDGIVTSDPTSSFDDANAIAVDSSAVYIAGYQDTGGGCSTGSDCWRIEKRDKSTGALVTAFDSDGIVTSDPTSGSDIARAIAVDGSVVYIAGYQNTGGDCSTGGNCWRIEKRDLTTGALVTAFDNDGIVTSDPTSGFDGADAVAVDSSAIYIAGRQEIGAGCGTGGPCWRIEKRDKTTGALITAFDGDGIAQSDPTSDEDYDRSRAITVDSTAVYIAGDQGPGAGCAGVPCWRIEKRHTSDGSLFQ